MKKAIDPNQLVTELQCDSLGRETLEKRPDGSQTTTTFITRKNRRRLAIVRANHNDERRSYDVYGARRNPEWGKPSGAIVIPTSFVSK